jgi:hypothetical protein
MFQVWAGNYSASILFNVPHSQAKEIARIPIAEFIDKHYTEFLVRVQQWTLDEYKDTLVLRVRVEKPFKDQASFASMVAKDFIPSLQGYINYVLMTLHNFEPIIDWGAFNFEIQNAEKTSGYKDSSLQMGGVYFPVAESPYNQMNYLDTGTLPENP